MSASHQTSSRLHLLQLRAEAMPLSTAQMPTDSPTIVGESDAIQRLRNQVRRLGPHFRTVLLRGEVGTGKELVGRALHGFSAHSTGPFVVFDAAPNSDAARDSVASM